jgi:hypothetical protein
MKEITADRRTPEYERVEAGFGRKTVIHAAEMAGDGGFEMHKAA